MTLRVRLCTLAVGLTAAAALPGARAAEEVALLRDLSSVIALLGVPCGQVVGATRQGDSDHVATCQDGNRYRVYLNPEGRVVAIRQ
ncbi:MAG: hypothetical protein RL375_1674 [Pseudomonadota bacterium]